MRFFILVLLVLFSAAYAHPMEKRKKKKHNKHATADTIMVDTLAIDSIAADTVWGDSLKKDTFNDSLYLNLQDSSSFIDSISADTNLIPAFKKDTISIIGVGDIMPGTDYPSAKYLPPGNNCHNLFKPTVNILTNADLTCGNLEGSLAGDKGKAKYCRNPDQCYVFRIPEAYISCIKEAGFDFLSIANNHSNDFGWEGRKNTIEVLKTAGIGFAGLPSYDSFITYIDSIKVGFCAFSPHTGTCNILDYQYVSQLVSRLDSLCDIVVVSFHGGAEGSKYQHVTRKTEMFLGSNRGNLYLFAHTAIDAGADIIFGHGPHVTRAVELYKDRLIAYSLGNFCTYARFNLRGPNGIAPILKVYTHADGTFIKAKIIPVAQYGEGGPVIDRSNRVIQKMKELTLIGFPDSNIEIKSNGLIVPKK